MTTMLNYSRKTIDYYFYYFRAFHHNKVSFSAVVIMANDYTLPLLAIISKIGIHSVFFSSSKLSKNRLSFQLTI